MSYQDLDSIDKEQILNMPLDELGLIVLKKFFTIPTTNVYNDSTLFARDKHGNSKEVKTVLMESLHWLFYKWIYDAIYDSK